MNPPPSTNRPDIRPTFARRAEKAGYPKLSSQFRKVTGEENLHAIWLRELYADIGTPAHGEVTQRAIDALETIQNNCDDLIKMNPSSVGEKAFRVAISVEAREAQDIYPRFCDQAAAEIYQRVVDSEQDTETGSSPRWTTSSLPGCRSPESLGSLTTKR